MENEKKPVRGTMPRSQLARLDYLEATSGSVSVSPRVAQGIAVSVQAINAGQLLTMAEAKKAAVKAVAARATQQNKK